MVDFLKNSNYDRIWLDIEGKKHWFTDEGNNREFFKQLLETSKRYKETGVYTKKSDWESIMGDTYTKGFSQLLWIPDWNGKATLQEFQEFGGWETVFMKQIRANVKVPGVDHLINENIKRK